MKPPKWTMLADGVQVFRVPSPTGFKWPEIVTVQLSQAEYVKFDANPKKYVNDHRFFPKDVREVFVSHMPRYQKSKAMGDLDMCMVIMHDNSSMSSAVTSEALPLR